jgi:hypothetical protein
MNDLEACKHNILLQGVQANHTKIENLILMSHPSSMMSSPKFHDEPHLPPHLGPQNPIQPSFKKMDHTLLPI